MKRPLTTETAETPAIWKLLPEYAFLQIMAEVHGLVAWRAYELFSASGSTHGHGLDDCLRAESEILKSVPFEIFEKEDVITVEARVPGWSANDIEVHVQPLRLFVSGEPHQQFEERTRKTIHSAESLEQMFRSIHLPMQIDPDKLRATRRLGQLQIELPKVSSDRKVAVAKAAARHSSGRRGNRQ
jgi:HSP20 family protein